VAYEVTTPLPGLAYFGMPFSVERADDTTWWGDASVLDDWKRNHSLLCQPSQGETLLRHYRPSLASRQLRRPKRQGFTLFGALARHAPVLRSLCVLLMVLSLVVLPAQVQGAPANFVLTWQHQQDLSTPATGFAVQRCIQSSTTSGTACNMSDLQGATQIPYTTPTYTDSTIEPNVTYCYQVAAINQFGHSPYSTTFCGQLGGPPKNAPAGLQLRIVPATP
jgi:hypothetical protein